MRADYLAYRRATSVSLFGLLLQLVEGLVLLIYAIYGKDHTAMTAAVYILLGSLIWLTLAVVFDQHRRERIEAIEAETLAASDAAGSSVFEEGEEELRESARRLRWMHRFLVPTISLVIGAGLIAAGWWRFESGGELVGIDSYVAPEHPGWALALGLGIAVIGFIFARFVSGMAKQEVWANLRGGAGWAVGSALLGLAIAIGHFIDFAGTDTVLRYLQVVLPIVVVVLGAEVFLNFLLNIYRPRKPGEVPRPAFDSRVLSFVAAPDKIAESVTEAINYQLGMDVSSSWFYDLLSRVILRLVALGVVVLWLLSCLVIIEPHQRGLVLQSGAFVKEIGPGLHFKYPWPIESVEIPTYTEVVGEGENRRTIVTRTATGVRMLDLGTNRATIAGPILWSNKHTETERYNLVRLGDEAQDSNRLTDMAIVAVEIPLHYAITSLEAYDRLGPPDERDDHLKAVGRRVVFQYLSNLTLGEILSPDREAISNELRARLQTAFDNLNPGPDGTPVGAGIEILFVGIVGAHPPEDAVGPFERVIQAQQLAATRMEQANMVAATALTSVVGSVELARQIADQIRELDRLKDSGTSEAGIVEQELRIQELIESAGGQAASLLADAQASRWQQHMHHRGRALAYQGQLAAYRASPRLYQAGLYFDALKESIRDSRVFLTVGSPESLHLRLDFNESDSNVGIFQPEDETTRHDDQH